MHLYDSDIDKALSYLLICCKYMKYMYIYLL